MGIGPEFIRRERASEQVAGTLDCVPTERMDRTPSSPIVVETRPRKPAPTVRVPISPPARTVQLSVAPLATVRLPADDAGAAPGMSRRLDSAISGGFFQEGERQEANGWEDSPLAVEPSPDEAPPAFSSFDRIPRKRAPLVVTTFIIGFALVVGLAVKGVGAGSWIASEAGQRVAQVFNKARAGLTIRLTPESTVASTRAMVDPVPAAVPAPPPVPVAGAAPVTVAAPVAPAAPVARAAPYAPAEVKTRRPLAVAPRTVPAVSRHASSPVTAAPQGRSDEHPSEDPVAPASIDKDGLVVAAPTEARTIDTPERRVGEPARRGVVWSPSEQRLVPAQQAAADSPAPATDQPSVDTSKASGNSGKPSGDGDKTVLPLDDEAHSTL